MDQIEKEKLIREAIRKCQNIAEDGWEDDDFGYIAFEVKKVLQLLGDRIGVPKEPELSKRLTELKGVYSNSRAGLDKTKEYLLRLEKEWGRGEEHDSNRL